MSFLQPHHLPSNPSQPSAQMALRRSLRRPVAAPWGWASAGVVLGLALALLVFAPGRWLAGWLQQASGGQFQLHAVRGSLWHGSARLTLTGGAGSAEAATLPGRVQWSMRPGLVDKLPALRLQWQADCCLLQPWIWLVVPRQGGAQIRLSDSNSYWPAGLLAGLGTPWNTLDFDGQLLLSTQALRLDLTDGRLQMTGNAQLDAVDLSSRLSPLRPMGSYRLALSGGTAALLQLSTLRGALQLSGQGQWIGNRLRFEGEASSAPESQAALANLLNIIGRRQGVRSLIKIG